MRGGLTPHRHPPCGGRRMIPPPMGEARVWCGFVRGGRVLHSICHLERSAAELKDLFPSWQDSSTPLRFAQNDRAGRLHADWPAAPTVIRLAGDGGRHLPRWGRQECGAELHGSGRVLHSICHLERSAAESKDLFPCPGKILRLRFAALRMTLFWGGDRRFGCYFSGLPLRTAWARRSPS